MLMGGRPDPSPPVIFAPVHYTPVTWFPYERRTPICGVERSVDLPGLLTPLTTTPVNASCHTCREMLHDAGILGTDTIDIPIVEGWVEEALR